MDDLYHFFVAFRSVFFRSLKKVTPFYFCRLPHRPSIYIFVEGRQRPVFPSSRHVVCVCVCVCVCVFVCLYNIFRNLAMLSYQKTEPQGRPPRSSPENDTRDVLNVRKQVSGNNPRHALNVRESFPGNIKTSMSPKKVTNACEHVKTCIQKRAKTSKNERTG